MAVGSSYKSWFASLPDHGFKEMVMANLDVGGNLSCRGATEQYVLASCLQEIVNDFVGSTRSAIAPVRYGLGVGASAHAGDAVKIAEERVHYSNIGHAAESDAARGFILGCTMHPYPVKNQVTRRVITLR